MTAPRRTPRGVECKDCKAERERRGLPYPANPRPAPYGGTRTPLCYSHFQARKKLAKSGAHERRVQREYGLKPGEYGKLYLAQGGRCAICGRGRGISKMLAVDHDHKTGLVRGLVDATCNRILGDLRDDVDAARRLVAYLVEPPAKRLGIVAVHREKGEGDG